MDAPLIRQTRINICAICDRIFMVPCKLDTQVKNSSVQKFIRTRAKTGSKLITEIRTFCCLLRNTSLCVSIFQKTWNHLVMYRLLRSFQFLIEIMAVWSFQPCVDNRNPNILLPLKEHFILINHLIMYRLLRSFQFLIKIMAVLSFQPYGYPRQSASFIIYY